MTTKEQDRIVVLEAELAAARQRADALETQRLMAMPQSADMTRKVVGLCTMPSPAELRALLNIVTAAHPCLRDHQTGFESAFRYVATLTPCEPGRYSRYANTTLLDHSTTWLNARGLPAEGVIDRVRERNLEPRPRHHDR